jgi:two-component system, chemotaxis family, CheB/CheR fusion protein
MHEYISAISGHNEDRGSNFSVVGVIASAADAAAFRRLLQHVPANSGMAFIFVPKDSPEPAGTLASVLAAATLMPVREAPRKATIEPNHVYVIPPNTLMRITGSVLEKAPRREKRDAAGPIDFFLQSLALDRKALAMAIAISGLDDDGALGLEAIRAAGGIAVVLSERSPKDSGTAVERMRLELTLANQRLQATLAERDEANHELLSANEEIQANIEELQTFNEELETASEELQATNEELHTLNEQLQNRNQELGSLNDDLANLLSSTTIPILMVDSDLRVRRVTPAAERLFNVRGAAGGRPIGDIRLRLGENLDSLMRRVIATAHGEEMELLDREGRWNVLRVRPYRTRDNRIEGAVLTMLDIDELHRAQTAADQAREFAESIVESVQVPLLVLKSDLRVRVANQAFLSAYGRQSADIEDRALDEIDEAQWNLPEFKRALTRLSNEETSSEELECLQDIPGAGSRTVLINARRVRQQNEHQILIAVQDITAHKHAEQIMAKEQARLKRSVEQVATALLETEDALRLSRQELRALSGSLLRAQDEERRRVSRELHDDVSQNIAILQFDIEALEQMLPPSLDREKKQLLDIRDVAAQLSNDLRRIAYALHPSTLDLLGLTVALSAYAREFSRRTGIPVEFSASGVPAEIPPGIASSFYRIAQEALRNITRHCDGCVARVRLIGGQAHLTLVIHDNGPGFDRAAVRGKGGLGLVSMEERARLIHASFELETAPGRGVTITVSAPLDSN